MGSASSILSPLTIQQGFEAAFGSDPVRRLAMEGIPIGTGTTQSGLAIKTSYAPNTPTTVFSFSVAIGRMLLIRKALLGSDAAGLDGFVQFDDNAWGSILSGYASVVTRHLMLPADTREFPLGDFLLIPENGTLNLGVTNPRANASAIAACLTGTSDAIELTASPQWDAQFKIGVIGDSIARGGIAGPNGTSGMLGKDLFWHQLRGDMAQASGKKIRVINKSRSGLTSQQLFLEAAGGMYDFPADLWIVGCGTNDCSNTIIPAGTAADTSPGTYGGNLNYVLRRIWKTNPQASIIPWAPPATDETSRVNNVAAYRVVALGIPAAVAAAMGTGAGQSSFVSGVYTNQWGGDLLAVDLSLAYRDVATYCAESTVGTRIHPNIAGHSLIRYTLGGGQPTTGGTGGLTLLRFWKVLLGLGGTAYKAAA